MDSKDEDSTVTTRSDTWRSLRRQQHHWNTELMMTKFYLVFFVLLHHTAATRFPYNGLSLPPFLPIEMRPLGIPPFARLPMLIPQQVLPARRLITRPMLLPRQRIVLNGPQRISQLRSGQPVRPYQVYNGRSGSSGYMTGNNVYGIGHRGGSNPAYDVFIVPRTQHFRHSAETAPRGSSAIGSQLRGVVYAETSSPNHIVERRRLPAGDIYQPTARSNLGALTSGAGNPNILTSYQAAGNTNTGASSQSGGGVDSLALYQPGQGQSTGVSYQLTLDSGVGEHYQPTSSRAELPYQPLGRTKTDTSFSAGANAGTVFSAGANAGGLLTSLGGETVGASFPRNSGLATGKAYQPTGALQTGAFDQTSSGSDANQRALVYISETPNQPVRDSAAAVSSQPPRDTKIGASVQSSRSSKATDILGTLGEGLYRRGSAVPNYMYDQNLNAEIYYNTPDNQGLGQPSSISGAGAAGTSATGTDSMTISFRIQGPAGTRISLIGNRGPAGTTGAKQGSNIILPEKVGSSAVTKVSGKTKTGAASGISISTEVRQSKHSAASVSSKTSSVNV